MPEPINPEMLAKIRRSDERYLRIAEKAEGALDEIAWERHVLLAEVDRLQAKLDRVARVQVVRHGCGGSVMEVVFASHLHKALGLPDGKAGG